jgi:pyruvate carboxylase
VKIARELQRAGVHILGIKDMAGVCRPRAARELVRVLREETGLPVHFHTHDTSGAGAASVLAAIEAGAAAVDAAMDALSGLTSQPSLNAIVAALQGGERDSGLDRDSLQSIAHYWEGVRRMYAPFESDIRAGTADVYLHEMPGGQYTNLREQARSMGLEHRWPEVSRAYAQVNRLFGDIVKVTPTSKVVGDMALTMVANDLTPDEVADPNHDVAFPESVVSLFRGDLGFPPDGFPPALSRKVLKTAPPVPFRPGDTLAPVDMAAARLACEAAIGRTVSEAELSSDLLYPKVFREFADHQRRFGDVSVLPTPAYFYGMKDRDEISVDIDPGKTLVIRLQGSAPAEEEGQVKLFFELNGQPRTLRIEKLGAVRTTPQRARAEDGNRLHVPAPMPGMIVTVAAKVGQKVSAGGPLVSIEAMKMESQIRADRDGVIRAVHVRPGDVVAARDLLIEFEPDPTA